MDPMVGTPVTATAASFGFTTTTHSPTTMTTKGLGRLMEEDDTISPQTEADFDFTISEVIPGFLYVGPEIETPDQAQQLMARPVKRVLNMAEECHDVALAPFIQANHIAYRKINARDTVEMQNIDHIIMDAVSFIEDAKKQHEGIYVHCKAGKSRSVTVVLAYLVACERWTLKQSYGHVIKARPNMSPNIGFMAELMKLENQVHGRVSSFMETDWSTVHHHPIHASPSSTAASPASLPLPHNHQDWQYSPSSPAPRAALTPSSVL
ncbi:protein-tyrosine phosphatase-like protein [Gongronella butleri]|nr:protein-tyrosine phosphatase-like protein [Gongronella butleri]